VTLTTETRSTLVARLRQRIAECEASIRRLDGNGEEWAVLTRRDTLGELAMLRVVELWPAALIDFDAWLHGEWLGVKHTLRGAGLAFAVRAWADERDPAEAFREYHDLFVCHEDRYGDEPDTEDTE
jgi:hypothetical protein